MVSLARHQDHHGRPLRRGWTTGLCAAAAARSAWAGLWSGLFLDPVDVVCNGRRVSFDLAKRQLFRMEHCDLLIPGSKYQPVAAQSQAGIIKDAGDDPDVTHGACIEVRVWPGQAGDPPITFLAGTGVGTVSRRGLPLAVGSPAINPGPRRMIAEALAEQSKLMGINCPAVVEISIPNGAKLSEKTWNERLGIVGGLSILGTTGIVEPFSCSAWIHAIQRGVDVARAAGCQHLAGCTGSTSQGLVQEAYDLPDIAMIDMGDFVGGLCKYIRRHRVVRLTIGGGFGKMCKLAKGNMDLHSKRCQVDFSWLADQLCSIGGDEGLVAQAGEQVLAQAVYDMAGKLAQPLAVRIAELAKQQINQQLDAQVGVDAMIIGRGRILARA